MSDFIEINQGIFVKVENIEAVIDAISDDPEVLCKVYTSTNIFPSALPSNVILQMIGVKEEITQQSEDTQEKMFNIMKTESSFAG